MRAAGVRRPIAIAKPPKLGFPLRARPKPSEVPTHRHGIHAEVASAQKSPARIGLGLPTDRPAGSLQEPPSMTTLERLSRESLARPDSSHESQGRLHAIRSPDDRVKSLRRSYRAEESQPMISTSARGTNRRTLEFIFFSNNPRDQKGEFLFCRIIRATRSACRVALLALIIRE